MALTKAQRHQDADENSIGSTIVDCAIQVHRDSGPGLLESACEVVLARAREKRGLKVDRRVALPFSFDGDHFEVGFRLDLLIEDKGIIELKSVETLSPVHKKQLLTYLKPSGLKLGFLLNFEADLMKHGIVRSLNGTI